MKSEIPYFSKIKKGGQGRRYFALKHVSKIENLKKILKFSIKIAHSLGSLLNFWKVWNLSFHWKKINVVTILDQNLVRFEICNETSIFQIFTWYSWKSRFSTIYKLKILKTVKRLSRTAMTLIFCSSERWDSILFKNSKGGPGKELFCFEIRLLN